jgi:hypothetical protein
MLAGDLYGRETVISRKDIKAFVLEVQLNEFDRFAVVVDHEDF